VSAGLKGDEKPSNSIKLIWFGFF